MTTYSEQPAAVVIDDVGVASSEMRCRRRERTEPESEPEALSGHSDSDCECPLAPQLKRLKLSEVNMAAEGRGDQDCCMAVDGTASRAVRGLSPDMRPTYYSEDILRMDDGSFKVEDLPTDHGRSVQMQEDCELEKVRCAQFSHAPFFASPSDLPMYPQQEATALGVNRPGTNRPTQATLRAEIQRRALEEMQRYRQSLRNYEAGLSVRPCDGF
eukprot:TRINITY_DN7760_c0_g1_i2.p1 TRINITY_DN7760_c0_g1~~TRINITY_DN7760_c0_g1_i2.p1  ORF type:complete len:214 (-),score=32.42 TRINITY_DN7760_c0_g1_i2:33-674(-)